MTEHIDHAAEARRIIHEATRDEHGEVVVSLFDHRELTEYHASMVEAVAHATLALVEQQRIANRIALGQRGAGAVSADQPYTPSETEQRIKREWLATHAGSGFEDLYESEWDRMIEAVRAEALREAREAINRTRNVPSLIALADKFGGYHQGERAGLEMAEGIIDRIEREAGQP